MPTTNSTFIYVGNLADLDPNEGNYNNENPNALYQTFDHTEMSVVTVTQNDDDGDGTIQENDNGQTPDTFTYDVGDGQVTSGLDNAARYAVTYVDENGDTKNTTVSAYQTENGDVFLRFPNNLKIQSVTVNNKVGDGYRGITYGASSNSEVVCFAPGTGIATPAGPRAVETLAPGDLVHTLDNGPQPVRWTRQSRHALGAAGPEDKPVLVAAGALGHGRPSRDLIVSPQHRLLVGGQGQLSGLFPTEALAPAKALTGLPGIRHMNGRNQVTWVHFACAGHEVVNANGCYTESLLLGRQALASMDALERRTVTALFGAAPAAEEPLNGPAARVCLRVGVVRRHLQRARAAKGDAGRSTRAPDAQVAPS